MTMKASLEVKGGSGERWPSLVLQGIALSTCISFMLNNYINNYFFLSILLVLSLFILQSIYRRFLMLYPMNINMNRPSPYIDTFIARGFIWIAYVSLFLGIYKEWHDWMPDLPEIILVLFYLLGFMILPITLWILVSTKIIQKNIARRLSEKSYIEKPVKCPTCGRTDAIFQRKIISSEEIEETIICADNDCKGLARSIPANIGN